MKIRIRSIVVASLATMLWLQAALAQSPLQRGEELVRGLCSRCHAIGKSGESPLPAAPRFRSLDDRTDLSKLSRRLREGLLTGHEDMPTFRFDRDDADATVAYIRSIQGP
jgi:cytochrome c